GQGRQLVELSRGEHQVLLVLRHGQESLHQRTLSSFGGRAARPATVTQPAPEDSIQAVMRRAAPITYFLGLSGPGRPRYARGGAQRAAATAPEDTPRRRPTMRSAASDRPDILLIIPADHGHAHRTARGRSAARTPP